MRIKHALAVLLCAPVLAHARSSAPLPNNIFDGGVISAESLGRGSTIASNRGTPASGSENPASLTSNFPNSSYTTVMFNPSSNLPTDVVDHSDPLENKTLQYLAIAAEKGVLFYEPISRYHQRQITDTNSPSTDFRDIDHSANAIGFAGVDEFGKGGSYGLSISYLWSSLVVDENSATGPRTVTTDTSDGVRMNFGLRYPQGPLMWGLSVQNAPAFLWGKQYRREMLPLKIRGGNTWRVREGVLFSFDAERRYYNEGGDDEDFFYTGLETTTSKKFALRAGAFGKHLDRPEDRHVTAGFTLTTWDRTIVSFAYEVYQVEEQKIRRSVLSAQFPFANNP